MALAFDTTPQLLSTFAVGPLQFGVEVRRVQELIRHQPMTRVPRAPGDVRGLINLRGQIVLALDVRSRLRLPHDGAAARPMNVVVRCPEGAASLLVDEICDVVEVDTAAFEPAPDTLESSVAQFVTGVFKMPDRLLLVLDVDRLLDVN